MSRDLMKRKFDEMIANKVLKSNSFCMSAVKYRDLLDEVKIAKAGKKINRHYWLLQHYDIMVIKGEEKLVTSIIKNSHILFYVIQEELFDVLYEIHDSLGHAGRDRMRKETQRRYKNITTEDVSTFLSLCDSCVEKKSTNKKGFLLNPKAPTLVTSRCQVDLIDYANQADGVYKHILLYQDQQTKFVILRPLKSDKVTEVAQEVLEIFLLFGAPNIIQSDIGRDFCKRIIEHLKCTWPQLKIVHGKAKIVTGKERKIQSSPDSTLRLKQELKNSLTNWMQDNLTNKWTNGLPFIQFSKNRAEHAGIKKSPYQAMFGHPAKMGLNTTNLPRDIIQDVNTEEDLEKITTDKETGQNLQQSMMVEYESDADDVESITNDVQEDAHCDNCGTTVRTAASNLCLLCFEQCQMNTSAHAQEMWSGDSFSLKTEFDKYEK